MATTILRLPAVKTRTGLSRSTIYLRVSKARFQIGELQKARGSCWSRNPGMAEQQIEASRKVAA